MKELEDQINALLDKIVHQQMILKSEFIQLMKLISNGYNIHDTERPSYGRYIFQLQNNLHALMNSQLPTEIKQVMKKNFLLKMDYFRLKLGCMIHLAKFLNYDRDGLFLKMQTQLYNVVANIGIIEDPSSKRIEQLKYFLIPKTTLPIPPPIPKQPTVKPMLSKTIKELLEQPVVMPPELQSISQMQSTQPTTKQQTQQQKSPSEDSSGVPMHHGAGPQRIKARRIPVRTIPRNPPIRPPVIIRQTPIPQQRDVIVIGTENDDGEQAGPSGYNTYFPKIQPEEKVQSSAKATTKQTTTTITPQQNRPSVIVSKKGKHPLHSSRPTVIKKRKIDESETTERTMGKSEIPNIGIEESDSKDVIVIDD
ncbi:hypothetical protein EIN_418130 [Entamoeba invadens IP1]|uniref:Uncharacterized protein n=1 Tax=Entamoeba invadens IP1 TaxID=370355 RepID=A0A0A1U1R3_ENTIV|nr:hypothetical protein EIN_418130 [Entamoeba invadens IP1]ELP87964.1 hypothetical protein EIN_418130 [Entamoeba invadens IP1]|eukprot:XP_004254735.1 hypothetical protein EIN_418130 [Entamoeba invadens IP1]